MSVFTTVSNSALTFSDLSPAKGVTGWAPIDAGADSVYIFVTVQISIAFAAGVDGNAILHIRKSADRGTTDSDVLTEIVPITYSAGNTVIFDIEIRNFQYAEVGIENDTSTEAEMTPLAEIAGLKMDNS